MSIENKINDFVINGVESKQVYDLMLEHGLINDNELYLVNEDEDSQDNITTEDVQSISKNTVLSHINSKCLTISSSEWKNDSVLYPDLNDSDRYTRIAVFDDAPRFATTEVPVIGGAGVIVHDEWETFTSSFTLQSKFNQLCFRIYGGKGNIYVHPYDIADVKVYRADDESSTNLLSDDIAKLYWWMAQSTDETDRFAVAYENDLKYIHVFKQSSNTSSAMWTNAFNNIDESAGFEAGTYIFSCRMRTTTSKNYCTLPFDGIRDASATLIIPSNDSSKQICLQNKIVGFAQRIGEISFSANAIPDCDLTLSIISLYGNGGTMSTYLGEDMSNYCTKNDAENHKLWIAQMIEDDDGTTFYGYKLNYTFNEIINHINCGGTVLMYDTISASYIPIRNITQDYIYFCIQNDVGHTGWILKKNSIYLERHDTNAEDISTVIWGGSGEPTPDTRGIVGSFYMDLFTGKLYKCTADSDNIYPPDNYDGQYVWEELANASDLQNYCRVDQTYSRDEIDTIIRNNKPIVSATIEDDVLVLRNIDSTTYTDGNEVRF